MFSPMKPLILLLPLVLTNRLFNFSLFKFGITILHHPKEYILINGLKNASYMCPRCGYVLPKKEAVVSGWDSEGSLRHVHACILSLSVYFDTFYHALSTST